jgi:hypothetical protein
MNAGDQQRIKAPPFSDRRIVQTAEKLTKCYVRAVNPDPRLITINFDHVYENYIYPEYGIGLEEDCTLGYDETGNKILGRFDIETNVAYIDSEIGRSSHDPRRVFTCWHEVGGHGILQGEWLRQELSQLCRSRVVVTTDDAITGATLSTLDRQANLFAAHAAAPTWLLQIAVQETFNLTRPIRFIGPRKYCLSVNNATVYRDVETFDHLCQVVAHYIGWRFGGLSVEALGYRVAEAGFVTDGTRPTLQLNRVARAAVRLPSQSPALAASGSQM